MKLSGGGGGGGERYYCKMRESQLGRCDMGRGMKCLIQRHGL